MSQTNVLKLLAGAAATLSAVSGAYADAESWSSKDEVRAIVAEMLADAETRSSLLQGGGMAGHDGKSFFLGSGDGNYRLNVGGQIQFRYYLNFRDDENSVDRDGDGDVDAADDALAEDDFESGFQTRRTKLVFDGNVINPNIFYKVQSNFSSSTGGDGLEEAYVGYRWDNGFWMKWGQFKTMYLREENVSSRYQLAADRSLTNETFNQDYSQGIELGYKAEDWQFVFAFTDGFGSRNTQFGTVVGGPVSGSPGTFPAGSAFGPVDVGGTSTYGEADYALTGRFEYKFMGDWNQLKDFTSPGGSDWALLLGIAGHWEGSPEDTAALGDTESNYGAWTVDLSLEGDGWNFFVAGIGSHTDTDDVDDGAGGTADAEFDDYGLVAQAGIMIPETDWEFFIRYDVTWIDDEERGVDEDDDEFSTLTFGTNWYWSGHAAKFTLDCQWFIDENNALANPDAQIGYLGDDDEGEIAIRAQFQLLF